jgi:nucleoside-diphosphate-sugar epimerase
MNRAGVTGGAGFIGSHVADRLRAEGVEVTIVDDFRTGRRDFIEHPVADPGMTVRKGDVLDQARRKRAMHGCDMGSSATQPGCGSSVTAG